MNSTTNLGQNIVFRLPNWLGDVCMALPVIKAIQAKARAQNADVQFAFLLRPQYIDLLEKLDIEGEKIALPKKNWQYFGRCLAWRGRFAGHILFTNSERGDLEAWLMASRQRFGITRPGKPRKLLTHHYILLTDFNEETLHQTFLWRDFTAHFGLHNGIDLSPCFAAKKQTCEAVGLICGSANTPEKRWAVENWQTLIVQLLQRGTQRIVLIGTDDDVATCQQIVTGVTVALSEAHALAEHIENLAGKTNLAELTDVMRDLSLVIGNDTGGLHIANALGVPVIGLYGYTNPIRCQPIHDAPLTVLQSPKGFGTGTMADITVDKVLGCLC